MCTRIFWADNPVAPVVSRTLDFRAEAQPRLWWLPAGMMRDGRSGPTPHRWTSRYASLTVNEAGATYLDGINEAGVCAHMHVFVSGRYEEEDGRPTMAAELFCQWVLDTCGSVAEALDGLVAFRITEFDAAAIIPGVQDYGMHFAIEDVTGDSAIIEGVDGRLIVHRGSQTRVMANAPSLEEQLANLRRFRPFGGELPVPGEVDSPNRFVRASYFLHHLTGATTRREALAGVLQVAHSVSKPKGAPYPSGEVFPTRWISAYDLADRLFVFSWPGNPSLIWVGIDDLADAAEPLMLDLFDPDLIGDVRGAMRPGVPTG